MTNTIPLTGKPGRPSLKLSKIEYATLKELYLEAGSFSQLARKLRMERMTITRILSTASGSPDNIKKIRTKLSKLQTPQP